MALLSGFVFSPGMVALRPVAAGRSIDLGTETVGKLSLIDAELDLIAAGTLGIGDANSGTITVSQTITRPSSTNVELTSGADIVISGGLLNTAGGSLLLAPGGAGSVQPTNGGVDATVGTLSFSAGADLTISIAGTTVDTQYTQFNVSGAINLNGVELIRTGGYVPAEGNVFTIVAATSVAGNFNGLADNASFAFNGQTLRIHYTSTTVTLTAVDSTAPTITGVFFSGWTWSAAFRTAAGDASYGYSAQVGANQLKSMPWSTVNTIYVKFSEDVSVENADLGLRGLNLANYSILSFTYDNVNFVAKWVLTSPIDTDRLILDLDGDSALAVTDTAGNKLAGSWTEGVSTFPTAGSAGNDFKYRFVVAVGDADRNGIVRNPDTNLVRANLFIDAGAGGYNIYTDIDGNGLTRNADVNAVRSHLFNDPPAGPGPNRPIRGAAGNRGVRASQTGGRFDTTSAVDQNRTVRLLRRPAATTVADAIDSLFEVD